jgi:TetR/AcrR family transcriptional repressor of nem operon
VNDIGREPAGSALRSRFTHAVKGLAGLIADRLPKSAKERRRQRSLVALSTMVGAVVLARGVDDEALADELLQAARSTITP